MKVLAVTTSECDHPVLVEGVGRVEPLGLEEVLVEDRGLGPLVGVQVEEPKVVHVGEGFPTRNNHEVPEDGG